MEKTFCIIEIGSNNTKTHIYKNEKLIFENNTTIEFKKNYKKGNKIDKEDLEKLFGVIKEAKKFTKNINIYGCSIFRNLTQEELDDINNIVYKEVKLKIKVISQEDEAKYTALGCYGNIDYNKNICIFIGGGGSIELILVKNKEIIANKYYNFGVVDITDKFPSLKDDLPTVSFDEVYNYIDKLIGNLDFKADVLILAGGDHFYWYNNAKFKLIDNNIYDSENQQYMITIKMSDEYDREAFKKSLNQIRANSDNPLWFDGSRAMKVITDLISHKIDAKYIIPTKINMEDGLKSTLIDKKSDTL